MMSPMDEALRLAAYAGSIGEVPVGAIVVREGQIIGRGYNLRESSHSATRHAELIAIEAASSALKSWRLTDCELFVTLEPCVMCAGALFQARIKRVHFGAFDPKGGALGSLYQVHQDARLNHRFEVVTGELGNEAAALLRAFFKDRR